MSQPLGDLDVAVYRSRWAAVEAQLVRVQAELQAGAAVAQADAPLAYRLRTLAAVAGRLHAFAGSQVAFLLDPAYPPPAGYSRAYGLALTLRQVGFDLEVIQQAADQRRMAPAGSAPQTTLDAADLLARRVLARALAAGLSGGLSGGLAAEATAFTYFQKSPYIAVLPYAPVALIGIAYSAAEVRRDLFAIPHEVGHYVYWNTPAGRAFAGQLPAWLAHHPVGQWAEEVFADAFAGLVAGPVGILSLQAVLDWHAADAFAMADAADDHPPPILRPLIGLQSLRRRYPDDLALGAVAAQLLQRWTQIARARVGAWVSGLPGEPARPIAELVSVDGPASGDKPLDCLIGLAGDVLADLAMDSEWTGLLARLAGRDLTDPAVAAEELDEIFARRTETITAAPAPELSAEAATLWADWLSREGLDPERPGDWLAIVHARGWTHGPGDNWPRTG